MVLMVEQGNQAELDLIKDCRRCTESMLLLVVTAWAQSSSAWR